MSNTHVGYRKGIRRASPVRADAYSKVGQFRIGFRPGRFPHEADPIPEPDAMKPLPPRKSDELQKTAASESQVREAISPI